MWLCHEKLKKIFLTWLREILFHQLLAQKHRYFFGPNCYQQKMTVLQGLGIFIALFTELNVNKDVDC